MPWTTRRICTAVSYNRWLWRPANSLTAASRSSAFLNRRAATTCQGSCCPGAPLAFSGAPVVRRRPRSTDDHGSLGLCRCFWCAGAPSVQHPPQDTGLRARQDRTYACDGDETCGIPSNFVDTVPFIFVFDRGYGPSDPIRAVPYVSPAPADETCAVPHHSPAD